MKALLLTDYRKLEMVDVPVPDIGADDILVRVRACGICGSDVHGFDGSTGRRRPPLIMGHEAAGEIAEVGANVIGFVEGDRVTFDSTVYCGKCFFCRRNEYNLCENREVLGVAPKEYSRQGAFAEFVSIPSRIAYKIPDNLPYEHAALIEAVSVGVHAVEITPVDPSDTVVIVGAGMIGLMTLQATIASGCAKVVAIDVDDKKLAKAKQLGATVVINSKTCDAQLSVLAMTSGRGADVVFECVGQNEPICTAIKCVRKGGVVTLIGNISTSIEIPLQSIVTRQIRLQGSCASSGEYPKCISLMKKGVIQVAPLISAFAPLSDGPVWFERLYTREQNLMKVVLSP